MNYSVLSGIAKIHTVISHITIGWIELKLAQTLSAPRPPIISQKKFRQNPRIGVLLSHSAVRICRGRPLRTASAPALVTDLPPLVTDLPPQVCGGR